MSEWKEYKLGEVTEPIKDAVSPDWSDNYAYIGLEHIEQESLRLNSVGVSSDVTSNKFLFKANDVLFGKLRPYFRKVVKPNFSGICSTDIWVLRAKKGFDQNYLYYFIANWDFVNTANSGEGGTRMPRADWNFLKTTEWSFPALQEQAQIASILSSLDDKIDLLHRQNKTLEQMAETLFRQWFVEEAEDWWETTRIENIAQEIQYGFTQSASQKNIGPKFLRITDIQGGTVDWDKVPYCPTTEAEFLKYEIKTGDIMIARTGASTGENYYAYKPDRAVFASYLIRIQFSNPKLGRYIAAHLRTTDYFQYIEGILSGSAQPNANAIELTSFEVQIPPEEKLNSFYLTVSEFDQKKYSNMTQIRTLTLLRDTLLPKLMSGEVWVN